VLCPQQSRAAGPTLGTQAGTTLDFAWLLVILPAAHLLLDSASLDQLPKTTHRLLDRLVVPQRQFDHSVLLLSVTRNLAPTHRELFDARRAEPHSVSYRRRHCPSLSVVPKRLVQHGPGAGRPDGAGDRRRWAANPIGGKSHSWPEDNSPALRCQPIIPRQPPHWYVQPDRLNPDYAPGRSHGSGLPMPNEHLRRIDHGRGSRATSNAA